MTKAALRTHHLAARDAIPDVARIEAALAVAMSGTERLAERVGGTVVAGYHPIRSELDPRPLMAALTTNGARLTLPAVISKTEIEFRELTRTGVLEPAGFGTLAPPATAEVLRPDVLLMPLSVFDTFGGRIGYGAGHYDRAIAKLHDAGRTPLLVGLAFDEQRAETVPQNIHDMRLALIITPTRIWDCTT